MKHIDRTMEIRHRLEVTYLLMMRIVEDLIRILAQRGLIKYSDFCDQSRELLREREDLREQLRHLLKEIGSLAKGNGSLL